MYRGNFVKTEMLISCLCSIRIQKTDILPYYLVCVRAHLMCSDGIRLLAKCSDGHCFALKHWCCAVHTPTPLNSNSAAGTLVQGDVRAGSSALRVFM